MPKYVSGKTVDFLRGASQEILKRSVSPLCVFAAFVFFRLV